MLVKITGLESGGSGSPGPLGESLFLPEPRFPFYQMIINILPFSQGWCGDQGREWLEGCINCKVALRALG